MYPIQHHRLDNNHKKGTANIISIAKLLEVAPEIPNIEAVRKVSGSWSERIRGSLEKALDALEDIVSWEYSNSKSVPLTDTQLELADYETFIKLFIKFDIKGAPDPTERLKKKKKEKIATAPKKAQG